jgi:hypothetical protein
VTGGKIKFNRVHLAAAALIVIVAALYFSDELRFYKLSVTVPEEGLTYDFDDNTLQNWVSTSQYIEVENGRVKASASGSGGTQTYLYSFDVDFEGWTEYTWDDSDSVVASSKYVKIDNQAVKFYVHGHVNTYGGHVRVGSLLKKEFDFTKGQTVTVKLTYQASGEGGQNIIKAYESLSGRPGSLLQTWTVPDSGSWTAMEIDLSDVKGKSVILYVGAELSRMLGGGGADADTSRTRTFYVDRMEITVDQPAFTTEGYLEQEFSFTKGFSRGTIDAITLQVDYASEAGWTGFWGVQIYEGSIQLASWQFTKGYLAWSTFTQNIRDLVAGKSVKIRVGGVISSSASWFIDNVRISYEVKYPFITVNLQSSYPASSWVEIPVTLGVKKSGLLVTAEIQDRGFEGITDSNGVAKVKVQTPVTGSYPIIFFATDPSDGVRHTVNETLNVLPILKATISAEASQHYDTPITFTVTTVDPDKEIRVDADALNVQVIKDNREVVASIEKLGTGEYLVSFTVDSAGTVKVTVDPKKSGYYSRSDEAEITVVQPKIVLTVNAPSEVNAGGQADVFVKTTDPQGNPVDADEVVVYVTGPNGNRDVLKPSRITKGTYLVTPSFPEEGLYRIEVKVSHSIYGGTSGTYTTKAVYHGLFQQIPRSEIVVPGVIGAALIGAIVLVLKRKGKLS